MARPSRTALYANDPTFLWKAILRLFAIIVALIGISLIAWALAHPIFPSPPSSSTTDDSSYDYGYSYNDGYYPSYDFFSLPWTFITLGLSVLWNGANLIVLLCRNKFIHPGANVGCDLVLWLGLIVTGLVAVWEAVDYICCYSLGNLAAIENKGIVIAVGAAMDFLVLLFHFALFISACRYTHARRHHAAGSARAKAITAEATQIAQQMIAEMTGPNGSFRPRSQHIQQQQQPQQESQQPLLDTQGQGEMQQQQTQRKPVPEPHMSSESSIVHLPPPPEPSHVANRHAVPEIRAESPGGSIHPGLRYEEPNERDGDNMI